MSRTRSAQTFIAVQCVQCCTMQVKQEKKSSNKWTCVVCNQKQSLSRIFARGPQAKELRVFVQGFNMARADPVSDPNPIVSKPSSSVEEEVCDSRKRRTDWSEYIDINGTTAEQGDDDENGNSDDAGLFVTEMPKKKQKKKEPSFPERRPPPKSQVRNRTATLVFDERKKEEEEASKWDEYMEEEKETNLGIGETLSDCRGGFWNDRKMEETTGRDLKVEDEVHPDFI